MDNYLPGEMQASIRDRVMHLLSELDHQDIAFEKARVVAQEVYADLKPQFQNISDKRENGRSTQGLDPSVSRRFESFVAPIAQEASGLIEELFSAHGDWQPSWHLDAALQNVMTIITLLHGRKVNTHNLLLALFGGNRAIFSYPPLVQQHSADGPATIVYWGALYSVLDVAALVASDWVGHALDQSPEAISHIAAVLDKGGRPAPEDLFAYLYHDTITLLNPLEKMTDRQWAIADMIGIMAGRSHTGLCWYPLVRKHFKHAIARFTRSCDGFGMQLEGRGTGEAEMPAFYEVQEEPNDAVIFAGAALRHIVNGEKLHIPATVRVTYKSGADGDEAACSCHIVINHPRLSYRVAHQLVQESLTLLRGSEQRGMQDIHLEFLTAVHESKKPEQRAPRGFWPRFVEGWNKEHPHEQLTPTQATVLYHQLAHK